MQNFVVNMELNWGDRSLPVNRVISAKNEKQAVEVAAQRLMSEVNAAEQDVKVVSCTKK
jgi:hypothetical protein